MRSQVDIERTLSEDAEQTLEDLQQQVQQTKGPKRTRNALETDIEELVVRELNDIMPRKRTSIVTETHVTRSDKGYTIRDGEIYKYGRSDKANSKALEVLFDHVKKSHVNEDEDLWSRIEELRDILRDYHEFDVRVERGDIKLNGLKLYGEGVAAFTNLTLKPDKVQKEAEERQYAHEEYGSELTADDVLDFVEDNLDLFQEMTDEYVENQKRYTEITQDAVADLLDTVECFDPQPFDLRDDIEAGDTVEVHFPDGSKEYKVSRITETLPGHYRVTVKKKKQRGRGRTKSRYIRTHLGILGWNMMSLTTVESIEPVDDIEDRIEALEQEMQEIDADDRVQELQEEQDAVDDRIEELQQKIEELEDEKQEYKQQEEDRRKELGYYDKKQEKEKLERVTEA